MRMLKSFVDEHLQVVSKAYRRARDFYTYSTVKPIQTSLGLILYGEQGLTDSRTESNEVGLLEKALVNSKAFVDVGANIGFFSCLASTRTQSVLAIEPHPYNLQCLYRNVDINNLNNVEIFPVALSDSVCVASLFGGGQGASLLRGWGGIASNYHSLTPVNTLDNLIGTRFAGEHIVIKIDVEGNEHAVLAGARDTLNRHPRPTWFVENGLTENFNGKINPNFTEVFEAFWATGYKACSVDDPERIIESADVQRWKDKGERDFGTLNYIFRPMTE